MQDTRSRLLQTARRLFAERGFRSATVREIAARAECNLASINYHFRSKEALYQEVLRETFFGAGAVEPPQTSDAESPRQKLSLFIVRMAETLDLEGRADRARLLAWETLSPTGLVDVKNIVELEPYLAEASAVVRSFCGPACESEILSTGTYWLLGQCMIFRSSFTNPRPDNRVAERLICLALEALGAATRETSKEERRIFASEATLRERRDA